MRSVQIWATFGIQTNMACCDWRCLWDIHQSSICSMHIKSPVLFLPTWWDWWDLCVTWSFTTTACSGSSSIYSCYKLSNFSGRAQTSWPQAMPDKCFPMILSSDTGHSLLWNGKVYMSHFDSKLSLQYGHVLNEPNVQYLVLLWSCILILKWMHFSMCDSSMMQIQKQCKAW